MNDLHWAILDALIAKPSFGLELHEFLRQRGVQGVPPIGALYPILRDLEGAGLLNSFAGETTPARGGRPRIYYELTGEGKRVALATEEEVQTGGWALVPGYVLDLG